MNPAKAIHRFPEIGTLGSGQVADVAVLEMKSGVFALKDAWANKRMATKKLECVLTVRDGKLAYDRNGLGFPLWSTAGEYQVLP